MASGPQGGFPFPFEPYGVQTQLMKAMWEAVENRRVGVFESPTGTGKTLSIICSPLHWLKSHEDDAASFLPCDLPGEEAVAEAPAPSASGTTGDAPAALSSPTRRWLARTKRARSPDVGGPASKSPAPRWLADASKTVEAERRQGALDAIDRARALARARMRVLEDEARGAKAVEGARRTGAMVVTAAAAEETPGARGRAGVRAGRAAAPERVEAGADDDDDDDDSALLEDCGEEGGHGGAVGEAGRLAALLRAERDGAASAGGASSLPASGLRPAGGWWRQLVFASRTHSQVTQFLAELRRTDVGGVVSAVHVGGRQQLCVNASVRALGSDGAMADRCLQLRDGGRRAAGCGCPFAGRESVDALAGRLATTRGGVDIEEAAELGRAHGACPYYAVRRAVPMADVVALPYTSLLSGSARAAVGIGLRGAVVVVDEAHNLAAAAAQANSATLGGTALLHACRQAEAYLARYRSRLRGRNVIECTRLVTLLRGLLGVAQRAAGGMPLVTIKLSVVSPAEAVRPLFEEPRAVLLAGGTMPPLPELRQQLFPRLPQGRLAAFACGHVVGGEALCGAVLRCGPAGRPIDMSVRGRAGPAGQASLRDLGDALARLAAVAPAGMVVFLPSYAVEAQLLGGGGLWERSGALAEARRHKRVFREPRAGADLDAVMRAYGEAALAPGGGALLFAVMGGKLSEGLNFKDGLARTVVVAGLPYPSANDPELRERMARMDAEHGAGAGRRLYEGICMQSVNQAIGRAVRHRGDWAATVLADARFEGAAVQGRLPSWLRPHVRSHATFGEAEAALARFFEARGATDRG